MMGSDQATQRCDAAVLDELITNALNKARHLNGDLRKLGIDFFGTTNGRQNTAESEKKGAPANWFVSTRDSLQDLNSELNELREELDAIVSLSCLPDAKRSLMK